MRHTGQRRWFRSTCLAAILLGCAVGRAAAQPPDSTLVRIEPETIARTERITVGDIAQVLAADEAVKNRLMAIDLGYAPDVGVVRELPLEKISLAISTAGFTAATVRVEGPEVAIIRRATQTIDSQYIHQAVEAAVLSELRGTGASVQLVRLDLPPTIEVAAGATEVRASIGAGRDFLAPFLAVIEIWAGNRTLRRFTAAAQVEAFAPVLVTVHDVPAGMRIRDEDTALEMRRLSRGIKCYVRDTKSLRGQAARRSLVRGEAIITDLLYPDLIIKPGDPVLVIAEGGRVHLEVKGEARAAGHVGDRIQVKNLQSGLLVQAVVEDEGLVRVSF